MAAASWALIILQFGHGGDAVGDCSGTVIGPPRSDRLQFGHGGDAVGDLASIANLLEWTPTFNSATAVTPWVTLKRESLTELVWSLQFGHGGDAVGDKVDMEVAETATKPSIRPRR